MHTITSFVVIGWPLLILALPFSIINDIKFQGNEASNLEGLAPAIFEAIFSTYLLCIALSKQKFQIKSMCDSIAVLLGRLGYFWCYTSLVLWTECYKSLSQLNLSGRTEDQRATLYRLAIQFGQVASSYERAGCICLEISIAIFCSLQVYTFLLKNERNAAGRYGFGSIILDGLISSKIVDNHSNDCDDLRTVSTVESEDSFLLSGDDSGSWSDGVDDERMITIV